VFPNVAALVSTDSPVSRPPAHKPPSGPNWIHEIKHDVFRLMARRDPVGIRLITRRGNDWTNRYPFVVEAVNHLKVRSCLIDCEVVLRRREVRLPSSSSATAGTPSTCWS
jgi:ATP-dependent DNA ligase